MGYQKIMSLVIQVRQKKIAYSWCHHRLSTVQSPADPYADAKFQMWQQQEQEKLRLEQAKRAELKNALNAETTTYTNNQAIGGQQQLYGSVKEEDYSQPQQTTVNIPKEPTDAGLCFTYPCSTSFTI